MHTLHVYDAASEQSLACLLLIYFPGHVDELFRFKVGSLDEAEKEIYAGADAITVQGREARGHVIGKVNLLSRI